MTRDEIIEMAREAGFHDHDFPFKKFKFEAFAKLVDAKATAKAVEREREACLQIQEDWQYTYANDLVQKIRARGEA